MEGHLKKITLFLIVFFLLSPNAYSSNFPFTNSLMDKELCKKIIGNGKFVETLIFDNGRKKINFYIYGKNLYQIYFTPDAVRCYYDHTDKVNE